MKRIVALAGLSILVSAAAVAQERVVIPARNTTHPRQVYVKSLNRSITVKTYDGKDVIVEVADSDHHGRERDRRPPADAAGMRRLDVPRGLEVTEEDNVIHINPSVLSGGAVTVTVPVDTSLNLKAHNGSLNVDGVHGEVIASAFNGRIEMTHVSGTVVADSFNGPIHVVMDRVDQSKPLSFSTFNAKIDVTFPADLKATAKFKTDRGDIYSDFEVAAGAPTAEPDNSGQGKYRLRFDGGMTAKINGGGVEINFRSFNGSIYVRKGK
jgi:hypothetical protein